MVEQPKVQWSLALVIVICATVAITFGKLINPQVPWFLYIVLLVIGFFVHTVILVCQTDNEQKVTDTHLKRKA